MECKQNSDCDYFYQCVQGGVCQHKNAYSLEMIIIFVLMTLFMPMVTSNGILVGICFWLVLVGNYKLNAAIHMFNLMSLSATLINVLFLIRQQQYENNRPLINYYIIMMMLPLMIVGSQLGIQFFDVEYKEYSVTGVNLVFMVMISYAIIKKYKKLEQKENRLDMLHNDNNFNQIHDESKISIQIPSDDTELAQKKKMELSRQTIQVMAGIIFVELSFVCIIYFCKRYNLNRYIYFCSLGLIAVLCSLLVKKYFSHKKFKASYLESKGKNKQTLVVYIKFWILALFSGYSLSYGGVDLILNGGLMKLTKTPRGSTATTNVLQLLTLITIEVEWILLKYDQIILLDELLYLLIGGLGSILILPLLYGYIIKNALESIFLKNVLYCFVFYLISVLACYFKLYFIQ